MYDPSAIAAPASTSTARYNNNHHAKATTSIPAPLLWAANQQYYPGMLVWHQGSVWRCEVPHLSASASFGGAPDSSFHLWTPISSTTPLGSEVPRQSPPHSFLGFSETYMKLDPSSSNIGQGWTYSHPPPSTAGPSSKPDIIAPRPESITGPRDSRSRSPGSGSPPTPGANEDDDSSPDSQGTVTARSPSDTLSPSTGEKTPSHNSHQSRGMSTAQFFSSKADESLRFLVSKQESGRAKEENEWRAELRGKRVWRVGGLGMWAYDLESDVEERKAAVWREWGDQGQGRVEWLQAANERTAFYEQARGTKPLVTWKLVDPSKNLSFPPDALQIGHDGGVVHGQPLFSARAWYAGGLHLGKAGPHLERGCCISYGGAEILLDTYEVLCAKPDPTLLKWICFRHGESVKVEGWQPVEGGRERDGQSLLVAKGEWEGGEHPGKCRITDDHAHIGWGGGELWIRPFFVLAYNSATRR